MKYIGPFLRINSLNKQNVENQLFYLSKEAVKHITLNSKCGIKIPVKELKLKNPSNANNNYSKSIHPLLCLYKKGNIKLVNNDGKLSWNDEKFKKEINVASTAFLTLSLLELTEYYDNLKTLDKRKYYLWDIFSSLTRTQLDFYASYLRNEDGVFVNKKDCTDPLGNELSFEEKNNKFNFSDQALLMNAYFRYSQLNKDKYANSYKTFAQDILNMFISYRNELYDLSIKELNKLCFAFNIFYNYSKNESAKEILLDLSELLIEKYNNYKSNPNKDMILLNDLTYINSYMIQKNMNILKFKEFSEEIYKNMLKHYNSEIGIFLKNSDKKEVNFYCDEIVLYAVSMILHSKTTDSLEDNNIIRDIFKRQIINSGLILSWPEVPTLNDAEHYKNFSLKSEDLIEDQNFRMPNIPTPQNIELAPMFVKYITFNRKKELFNQKKFSFDSYRNMSVFFTILHLLKFSTDED